jgi:hypothetical protein
MASFLDNNSDIILDAVLTDYGRQLLAKGDGSFNIVKFAFGDDEIDYSLWDQTAASSLKDVNILTTPIMEAFTNNAASLKSKLLTINIENLLYLPILKLNTEVFDDNDFPTSSPLFSGFVVPVDRINPSNDDSTTSKLTVATADYKNKGLLLSGKRITIDQGLDSANLNKEITLNSVQPELYEREYNIIIDNRLGVIHPTFEANPISYVSLDDDNMATYRVSETVAGDFVRSIVPSADKLIIQGYQGSRLQFTIKPTTTLINSNALFTRLGQTQKIDGGGSNSYYTIRTSIKVVGVSTGYSLDIPILFAKKI